MWLAWCLAEQALPKYSSKFSRKDFTRPQLFACLVVKEHLRRSYRGAEILLRDCQHGCRAIGMSKVPDHNTLHRAAGLLLGQGKTNRLLDVMGQWAAIHRMLGLSCRPLALDSSMYESHHVSRYYERRQRSSPRPSGQKQTVGRLPKLAVAVDVRSHLVLAIWTGVGTGSDSPHFEVLLFGAWRRAPQRRFVVVADGGYDAEHNHQLARRDMGLRSILPASIGRVPSDEGRIRGYWRRRMRRLLRSKRSRRRCGYTQRWQAETVNSMMKRNLGSALRGKSSATRQQDLRLKVLVHNLMIFRCT